MFITYIYPEFLKEFPSCHFNIVCSRSRAIRRSIEKGSISAAIVAMEPQFRDDQLLWEEPLYWACAKGYSIPKNKALPIALFSDDCIVNTYTLYSLKHMEIDYDIVFTSTMSENIEEAVRKGIAVSLLPASSVTEDMDLISGSFSTVPLTLKVGFAHNNTPDIALYDSMFSILKNKLPEAGLITSETNGYTAEDRRYCSSTRYRPL